MVGIIRNESSGLEILYSLVARDIPTIIKPVYTMCAITCVGYMRLPSVILL